jgi:outer membrane protein assembly factor BamB
MHLLLAAAMLAVKWHVNLGSVADTMPIVAGDRLYETATDGTTYAVDTQNGRILWRFATHGPKITTSVPALDADRRALYVPGVDGMVHKLDPATGRELRENGFPVRITLAPETEKNASPLRIANGYLYAQTSGYLGDATPYVGHVAAIRLSDGSEHVFNSLCSEKHVLIEPQSCGAQRSGMWSRAGVAVDPDPSMHGRVYVASGNGPFDASGGNYGDTILSISDDATKLLGYLTPSDYATLDAEDRDVGSSSPVLLPRQRTSSTPLLAVQGGKDAVLRLFDRTDLRGLAAPLQTISLGDELFSAPAVWTNAGGVTYVLLGLSDGVHAYRVTTSDRATRLVSAWHADVPSSREGASPVVDGDRVVMASANGLIVLDAQDGRRIASSNALGPIHWEVPAVSGDTIYCSDETGALTAFTLTM